MTGADYFSVVEINAYESATNQPDRNLAQQEHLQIKQLLKLIGVEVIEKPAPINCQDGIYTANWALIIDHKIVLSRLPNLRQAEEKFARSYLQELDYDILDAPYIFSGQGDALVCGDYLFVGSGYRTDKRMWPFLEKIFNLQVIGLHTIPAIDKYGKPIINKLTSWPDSYFYDLDLALSIISPELIAWCPEAFDRTSQEIIRQLKIDKIEIDYSEAVQGLACNLISTGTDIVMSNRAPKFQTNLEAKGFKTYTPNITELSKGGGYIRCIGLTL